jgi:hypothetical protein
MVVGVIPRERYPERVPARSYGESHQQDELFAVYKVASEGSAFRLNVALAFGAVIFPPPEGLKV